MALPFHRFMKILRWRLIHFGRRRDITVETWNGLLTCDSKDWLIGKYLYVDRSYESANIERTINLLQAEGHVNGNGGIVLDVGANIGMISIALLKRNYFNRAVAFEPEPNNFRLLLRNVNQNFFTNQILCLPYALSSTSHCGRGALEISPDNFGDHRLRDSDRPGFYREERRRVVGVEVRTLDDTFADRQDLHPDDVSLIWVDIQGHEGHFFEGARHMLKRRIPVVSEFWPYAIERSGMSLDLYRQTVVELFTHFYWFNSGRYERKPITEIQKLFEIHNRPRSGDQLVFVSE